MKLLARNKQTIYYRNYSGMTAITEDDNETLTGEYEKSYGAVKTIRAYVKSAVGDNAAEPFGDFTSKRRTVYIEHGVADDVTEQTIFWIGINPQVIPPTDAQGNANQHAGEPTVPHNFTVDGIAYGLNHIRIAVRQVEVRA